jgi:hypothetical protein
MPKAGARVAAAVAEGPRDQVTDVEIYSQEAGYVVAVAGKYLIQILRDRTTQTTISQVRRALSDLSDRHPTFGYLAILEPDMHLMIPPEIREGVDAYVKRYSSRFTGAAIVFERTGFQGTAVRSVVTAINLASRAKHPTQVFSQLTEAVSWLHRLTPGEYTVARLLQVARQLRAVP